MSKDTPDTPWSVDYGEEPYENLQIRDASGHAFCEVFIDDAPVEDYNAEQRRKARLIATAPDMLEALESARRLTDGTPWTPAQREGIAEEIRAAIAKATGA